MTAANLLPKAVPADQVTGARVERIAEHQLLLNQLALEFAALTRLGEHFTVRFISSTSPFHLSAAGGTVLRDKVEFADGSEATFAPDAAVCVTHPVLKKSLLFLVEIDIGTMTIADPKHVSNADVRRKIIQPNGQPKSCRPALRGSVRKKIPQYQHRARKPFLDISTGSSVFIGLRKTCPFRTPTSNRIGIDAFTRRFFGQPLWPPTSALFLRIMAPRRLDLATQKPPRDGLQAGNEDFHRINTACARVTSGKPSNEQLLLTPTPV